MEAVTINAGQLRHEIAIQGATRVSDGQGGGTKAWATITDGAVWAEIEPVSAKEEFVYQQLAMRVTHKVTLRYLAGVTAAHRVLFGSRAFNIRGIRNIGERNTVLVLFVEEGVPG